MDLELMQPYLFPYIGYFQLINYTDCFVISDNVQYIKQGWINRNNILIEGKPYLLTFPVKKESTYSNINKRYFLGDINSGKQKKILRTIDLAYRKAPYFEPCYTLIEEVLRFEDKNVAIFIENSLKIICDYLGIRTKWYRESELNLPSELNAQDKIIQLCKQLDAKRYINAVGGMKLYSPEVFAANGVVLKFIKTRESLKYKQFENEFVPNLSIIDVMMFNSKIEIQQLLTEFDIIDGKEEMKKL